MPYRKQPPKLGWLFGSTATIKGKEIRGWSRKHRDKAEKLGLTLIEYVNQFFVKNGKLRLTMGDIIRAKCFRCCEEYYGIGGERGKIECNLRNCSLYWWTPYREQRPLYDWMFDSEYMSKHRTQLAMLGLTREEYIDQILGHNVDEPGVD